MHYYSPADVFCSNDQTVKNYFPAKTSDMYRLINWGFDHINRWSPILFQTPSHRSYGNGAEEIFYGLLKAKRENKKVLFLFPRIVFFSKFGFRPVNRESFQIQSDYSISNEGMYGLLGGWLLSIYLFFLFVLNELRSSRKLRRLLRLIWPNMAGRPLFDGGYSVPQIGKSTLWKPQGVGAFSWNIVEERNWKQQYDEYIPPRLQPGEHRHAERIRTQMGIPLADWFVCLHVSENQPRIFKNASIANYIEAINVITAAGGWVVRLGDPAMTPLPPMERVIDYVHTPYRSKLMDIYLISQCRFLIGLNSGPLHVAMLFRKQMVLVNMVEWSLGFPLKKGDLAIIMHIYSRSRHRFLSIKEILEEPFTVQAMNSVSDGYEMVENTPEEIRDIVQEFLNKPEPYEYSNLQETFNEARKRHLRFGLEQGEPRSWSGLPARDIVVHQYRIASLLDAAEGTFGEKYLEQNWLVDSLEKSSSRISSL